jgi:hypothetical protein
MLESLPPAGQLGPTDLLRYRKRMIQTPTDYQHTSTQARRYNHVALPEYRQ